MNWDAIGAIAETLGAVGVIATLAYLAVQIRQNTTTVRSSAASAIVQTNNSLLVMLAQDAEVSRIWWAGLSDPAALSEADLLRFNPMVAMQLNAAQGAHTQVMEGAITQRDWDAEHDAILWLASQPGFITYWETWANMSNLEFTRVVTDAIQQSGLPGQRRSSADPS
jgi:hypothetical protein